MFKLNSATEPEWLELSHGVRVKAAPLTTAVMIAARNDPAVRDLPETASDEERSIVFTQAVARRVISEWEGVGDDNGEPIPPTPEGIDALIGFYAMFKAFEDSYIRPGMELDAEKNASALSPSGTSAGATDTAQPAKAPAPNAHTKRTGRKR
ncbi:MAG: hypothetical protein Kow0032_07310 [Methyloligellaceae bacterium]